MFGTHGVKGRGPEGPPRMKRLPSGSGRVRCILSAIMPQQQQQLQLQLLPLLDSRPPPSSVASHSRFTPLVRPVVSHFNCLSLFNFQLFCYTSPFGRTSHLATPILTICM